MMSERGAASPGLGARAFNAAGWQFSLKFSQAVIHFGVGIVLARLLPPEDFGLLGLAPLLFVSMSCVSRTRAPRELWAI